MGEHVPGDGRYVPFCLRTRWCLPFTWSFRIDREIPALTHGQWLTLTYCSLAGFLYAYDWELWPLALPFVQSDLNVSESDIGLIGSAIRFGNGLSFPVSALGDWYGRKLMNLVSVGMFVLFTTLSGFSQNAILFMLLQVFARCFMAAQNTLSTTMIVEGLDASDRGWGVGTFSAVGVLGSALALLVFGILGDQPGGWRVLYVSIGVLFIPMLLMNRFVPESRRFVETKVHRLDFRARVEDFSEAAEDENNNDDDDENNNNNHHATAPGKSSASPSTGNYPELKRYTNQVYIKRLLACVVVSMFNGFAFAPSDTFKIKKLIEVHKLSAAGVSVIQITTGWLAFAAFTLAGSLSDRYGRKKFFVGFNSLCTIGVVSFYLCPAGPLWLVYVANFLMLMSGFVLSTVKATYFAELFPTSRRATAQGLFVACDVVAGSIALIFESVMQVPLGHWVSCALLALPAFISSGIALAFLPEITGSDLESVSPELFSLPSLTLTMSPIGIPPDRAVVAAGAGENVGDVNVDDDDGLNLIASRAGAGKTALTLDGELDDLSDSNTKPLHPSLLLSASSTKHAPF